MKQVEMNSYFSADKAHKQTVSLRCSSLDIMSCERRTQSLICISCPAIWLLSGYKHCANSIYQNTKSKIGTII